MATVHIANSVAVLAEIGSTELGDAPVLAPAALKTARIDADSLPEIVFRPGQQPPKSCRCCWLLSTAGWSVKIPGAFDDNVLG